MKLRLLRLAARFPLVSLASVLLVLGASLTLLVSAGRGLAHHESDAPIQAEEGREILGRMWLDRWPESAKTQTNFLLFMAGGIGLHEEGAAYKFSIEVFEFERKSKRIEAKFLDDGAKKDVDFTIERCSDLPPFDLCLRLQDQFRGPRTYYSFAREDELTERAPWLRGELELARARGQAPGR